MFFITRQWTELFLLTLGLSLTLPTMAEKLSIDRINSDPSILGKAPTSLKISPDGSRVTFLRGKDEDFLQQDLWSYNLTSRRTSLLVDSRALYSGDESLSDEEKARRERQRVGGHGIVEYFWSDDGQALVFPVNGDLYLYDLSAKDKEATRRLTKTDAFETDVKFSPGGNYISFVREQNLYVIDLATGIEKPLTSDGGEQIKNGMAEFVAQEEMDRFTGYWWSDDESYIAFSRVDESPVNIEKRYEIDADSFSVFEQRYPRTGTPNVKVELGVVEVTSGEVNWLDLGSEEDIYLVRVAWLRDSETVAIQRMDRSQHRLDLLFSSIKTGKSHPVLKETSDTWVNLHDNLYFLKDSDHFIWSSERNGYSHLYLYNLKGQLQHQLTAGDWVVNELKGVDEERELVYFDGFATSTFEKHLYSVPLNGESPEDVRKITRQEGWHSVELAGDYKNYVDKFSTVSSPAQVSLNDSEGNFVTWLEENRLDKSHPYFPYLDSHITPEFGKIPAEDGQMLDYKIFKPSGFDPQKRYPVVLAPYGGPAGHRVTKSWNADWNQILANEGYVVFILDNRGSDHRGKAFEDVIYRKMGEIEVTDQITGVDYLKQLSYVDPERIGIWGWSYGGYMALMTQFKNPDIIRAAVAVAPVTQWELYDTFYTERYLDRPQDNPDGYLASSVFPYIPQQSTPLLVIHGMADDNVLFLNSTKLFKTLQEKDLPFEMMTYPGAKHGIRGKQNRKHLFKTILSFLDRNLKKPESK
jgi:dipeptidyl-peptidase-4